MTLEESIAVSRQLARRIEALGVEPAVVVGVARGGLLPARVVADVLRLPLEVLELRRGGSRWKSRLARVPGLRALASWWYRRPFASAPLRWAFVALDRLTREPWETGRDERHADGQPIAARVVLVDDAQLSGRTLDAATRRLRARGATHVTRAVLTWKPRPGKRSEAPDAWLTRDLPSFPWSLDSPYLREWRDWIAARHLSSSAARCVLLVDLDGVLVAGQPRPGEEILRAHEDAPRQLAALGADVRVLTHRSRNEARELLDALGFPPDMPLVHAGTLWWLTLTRRGARRAWRDGATKDVVLDWLVSQGVPPQHVAVIDDRPDVSDSFARAGAGLVARVAGVRVETSAGGEPRLRSFSLPDALAQATAWLVGDVSRDLTLAMQERTLASCPWARTGRVLRSGGGGFGALRRAVRALRRAFGATGP